MQLHGIVSTWRSPTGACRGGANIVDRGLAAPHHQHMFCFRLDLDVDGARQRAARGRVRAVPVGPDNPVGNAFRAARDAVCRARTRHAATPTSRLTRLDVSSAERATPTAGRPPTGSSRATAPPPCWPSRARASTAGPASPGTRCGPPATTARSASRPAPTRISTPTRGDCPPTAAAARSRTRTS